MQILLGENVKIIDDIIYLAEEIISIFFKHNKKYIENCLNLSAGDNVLIKYYYDSVDVKNSLDIKKYPTLLYFFKENDLEVFFSHGNLLYRETTKGYAKKVKNGFLVHIKLPNDDLILKYNELKNNKHLTETTLKIAISESIKNILIHELRHCYDMWKQGEHFAIYRNPNHKKIQHEVFYGNDYKYFSYMNIPHEYWARFTEALSRISHPTTIKDNKTYINFFIREMIGFSDLPKEDQKRLIKAAINYYYLKNDN